MDGVRSALSASGLAPVVMVRAGRSGLHSGGVPANATESPPSACSTGRRVEVRGADAGPGIVNFRIVVWQVKLVSKRRDQEDGGGGRRYGKSDTWIEHEI